ncbi:MAG: hypothetical protein A3F78_22370 [Burkholderiales bacterium RIFCSPLOWO2_12_FULL_61_40]|nr:MAG: hypothetical protein A3F78_22370 [Burkholderiales bacterium RIFCSPLOWO2_12_FULL_61_40]
MESISKDAPRQPEVNFRLLFERNPLPIWVYDIKTRKVLAVNDAALAQFGPNTEALIGQAQDPQAEIATVDLECVGGPARMAVVKDRSALRHAEQAVRTLTLQLSSTLESIAEAFFSLDRDWRFTYVNARAEELLGYSRDQLLGCRMSEKLPDVLGGTFQAEFTRAMEAGEPVSFEAYYGPSAVVRKLHLVPSDQGLAVYFRDLTEPRVPEQRLQEEREILFAVVNSTTDAIIATDFEGRIQMFNKGAEHIFHRTFSEVQGKMIEMLLPERFRSMHSQHRQRFAEARGGNRSMGLGLVKGLRADGQEIDLEGTISQVRVHRKQLLITNLKNVSERLRVSAEVEQSRAQLLELTQRLMVQEKTLVKRLAQVLHDQLGQTVAAIRMAHETIGTLLGSTAPAPVVRLQAQMGMLVNQAVRQVRQVLVDLRPPLLEEQGLAAALDNELRNRSVTHPQLDISIHITPETAALRWPPEVEYAAFMVAREALENALRHSGASAVWIDLVGSGKSLRLDVTDNGTGIQDGAIQRSGHIGLFDMRERANAVAASVSVGPHSPSGTRVRFNWRAAP